MTRAELKPRRIEAANDALLRAALKGDSVELARQLHKGAQPDHVDPSNRLALELFQTRKEKLIARGVTALLNAVGYDHAACVRQLLAAGADVNHANLDGLTALHVASAKGNKQITEMLLAAGVSVRVRVRVRVQVRVRPQPGAAGRSG